MLGFLWKNWSSLYCCYCRSTRQTVQRTGARMLTGSKCLEGPSLVVWSGQTMTIIRSRCIISRSRSIIRSNSIISSRHSRIITRSIGHIIRSNLGIMVGSVCLARLSGQLVKLSTVLRALFIKFVSCSWWSKALYKKSKDLDQNHDKAVFFFKMPLNKAMILQSIIL